MTDEFVPASPQLQELHKETVDLGYEPGLDFSIRGIPQRLSSELIVLAQEGDVYVVYYRDMGRSREVARSSELDVIRTHFFDQLADLAGPRGRGPWAGRKRPSPYEGMSTEERIEAFRKLGWFPTAEEVRARQQEDLKP